MYCNWNDLELKVLRWAEARRIIPNSTPQAQILKTVEELGELAGAIAKGREDDAIDAFGDVVVTLIIAADMMGTDLKRCLGHAYEQIKDRKGHLRPDGIFVKEEA